MSRCGSDEMQYGLGKTSHCSDCFAADVGDDGALSDPQFEPPRILRVAASDSDAEPLDTWACVSAPET